MQQKETPQPMDGIRKFEEIARNPYDYARLWQEKTGRPVVGYLCSYTPEEILHAAGVLPLRLFGGRTPAAAADAHLQAYSCSLARGVLADALNGELDFLSGAVFPHTCDTIQRLSDLWRMNARFAFHADVVLPVKLDTESARAYLAEVLARFVGELEAAFGVSVTEERLLASIEVFNRIRRAFSRLYRIRAQHPEALDGAALDAALQAAAVADRDALPAMVEELAENAQAASARAESAPKKRLIVSGGLCRTPGIHRIVASAGGVVVDDDLCTGRRFFDGRIDPGSEPMAAIARRYAERVLCPAKHRGTADRSERLLSQVRDNGAHGVVFYLLKFCDPHGFDYPHLKEILDREGIPSLLLEMEDPAAAGGQAATRLEAFIENL